MSTGKARAKQIQVEESAASPAGSLQELIESRKILPIATTVADGAMSKEDKAKLTSLEGSHWRGTYISVAALDDILDPTAGDYADVDAGVGYNVERWIYDVNDTKWVAQGSSASVTAAQVKQLYESNADTNAFTDTEKTKLTGIASEATKNRDDSENADKVHTHTIAQVDGLDTALADKVSNTDPRLTDSREWTATTIPQAEAEAGEATTRRAWTAQRVRQAIVAWFNGISGALGRTILSRTTAEQIRSDLELGTAATKDVGTTAGTVAAGDDSRIVNASPTLRENIKVTVGAGGDFPTINAAVLHLSRFTPDLGVTAEVELMSGFVMEEQLFIYGLNLGWITITGVDAETVINETSLTESPVLFVDDIFRPAFWVAAGTLPIIGQLFSFSSKGDKADNRVGVATYDVGRATILEGCGVKNAGLNGIFATIGSTVNARGAILSGAGSANIAVYQGSTINAKGADVSGAGTYGITATEGSIVNARDADASGAGTYGFRVVGGSIIEADRATGTLSQAKNTVTADGIIFQP